MEKKNYYLIILAVVFVAGFFYYQSTQKNKVDDNQKEEESIQMEDTSVKDLGIISTTTLDGNDYEEFLVGDWKSTDSQMSKMLIKADGTIEYTNIDGAVSSGTWSTEGFYMKTFIYGNNKVYNVWFAGAERLELSESGSEKHLNFVRIIK